MVSATFLKVLLPTNSEVEGVGGVVTLGELEMVLILPTEEEI